MKKIGLICLAVVLTLGIAGVGFGWWSETLSIGANPVQTGELDVDWAMVHAVSAWPPKVHYDTGKSYHWGQVTVSGDGNTLSVELHKMYPSAEVITYPRIYNNGTIPVKITGYTVTKTGGSDALWNALEVKYSMVHYYSGGNKVVVFTTGWMSIGSWQAHLNANATTYPYPPGPYGTTHVVLAPGDYLTFDDETLMFHINSGAGNDIETSDVQFTVEVGFTQFNAP